MLLSACAGGDLPSAGRASAPASSAADAAAPTQSATPAPTSRPPASPTRLPQPTATPSATASPIPSATARPADRPTPSPAADAPSARTHVFPVRSVGKVSYGRFHHDYPAADIFCPIGSEFLAVTDGVVDYVSREDTWDPAVNDGATRGGLSV